MRGAVAEVGVRWRNASIFVNFVVHTFYTATGFASSVFCPFPGRIPRVAGTAGAAIGGDPSAGGRTSSTDSTPRG